MALSLKRLTRIPFTRPARIAQPIASKTAGQQQSVVALRIVGRYDDGERDAARERKVETSLLNHQQLSQADNGNDGRERQASGQGAPSHARRGEQKTRNDQRERGDDNRHKAFCPRQKKSRSAVAAIFVTCRRFRSSAIPPQSPAVYGSFSDSVAWPRVGGIGPAFGPARLPFLAQGPCQKTEKKALTV